MLGDLRSYLSGITVDRLTSCNDQVIVDIAKSTCDRCGGCPCIRTTKHTVCHKDSLVSAHCHCFTKNFFCFGKSHGKNGNLCTVLLFDAKCCFQTSLIIRVHNCKHCTSVKCTIRIEFYSACCVRYLFYTNYYFHDMNLLISISFQR